MKKRLKPNKAAKTSRPRAASGARRAQARTGRATKESKKAGALEIDPSFLPVAKAFANDRRVSCGKMMSSVGLKVNGKIFAMLVRGKFVAKLPKERVDELVESRRGDYFDPRRDGRLMKEWVELRGAQPPWI